MANVDNVIERLSVFEPREVDIDNTQYLYRLLDGFDELPRAERQRVIPHVFAVFERHPDADLGNPGPLVHALEAMGGYELELRASLERQATYLAVWMVNRILNSELDGHVRREWLSVLERVAADQGVAADVRDEATGFLEYQRDSGTP